MKDIKTKNKLSAILLSSIALVSTTHAGFSWINSVNTTSVYSIGGGGQGIMNSLTPGDTSSGGNASHELQGVDVRYEAYDKAGNALTLGLSDLNFSSDVSSTGQQFTTNIAIDGYIKITYDFTSPWVSAQNSGSPWAEDVAGSFFPFGIESKFTFVNNVEDYNFTHSWWNGSTQLDPELAFLIDDGIILTGNVTNTIKTGFDGTGTGNYMFGSHSGAGADGDSIQWHGDFDHNPFTNQYDRNELFILPTGNATNAGGDAIIAAGTTFGMTTNGAVLVPEPSSTTLLPLCGIALILRRRR